MAETRSEAYIGSRGVFATTHWSIVLAATSDNSPEADAALEQLCRDYWYPIYVYVRRKGHGPDEAQDLTQEFFAQLLSRKLLTAVDPAKGRFRSFLLAVLDHFLAREWTRANRQKRGGQYKIVSFDGMNPEERYAAERVDDQNPARLYERQWALAVLEAAMNRLRAECRDNGKAEFFDLVRNTLSGEPVGFSYSEVGQRLGMSEGAVQVAVHRLRQRYGELMRAVVAETVASPGEIKDEMEFLFRALEP